MLCLSTGAFLRRVREPDHLIPDFGRGTNGRVPSYSEPTRITFLGLACVLRHLTPGLSRPGARKPFGFHPPAVETSPSVKGADAITAPRYVEPPSVMIGRPTLSPVPFSAAPADRLICSYASNLLHGVPSTVAAFDGGFGDRATPASGEDLS